MSTLYVQNQSTVVTDAQAQAMTRACAYQARWHFAPAWNQIATNVLYLDRHTKPSPGTQVIVLLDDSDQQGALGYHSEGSDGVAYGRVFAKPSLDNGAGVFTGEYAVSATLSHEVLEFIADPNVSYWAAAGEQQDGSPVLYAFEVCLSGDTQVHLAEGGTRSIADLARDNMPVDVVSSDEHGRPVRATATRAFKTGRRKTVRIRFTNGSTVCCTADHRFRRDDGSYVEAAQLRHGDVLPGASRFDLPNVLDGEAVALGEDTQRLRAKSDVDDVCVGDGCTSMGLADAVAVAGHPALGTGVSAVVVMGTHEQVFQASARRVVALMADLGAGGKRSVGLLDRPTVYEDDAAFITNVAVTGVASGPRPDVAGAEPCSVGGDRPIEVGATGDPLFEGRLFEVVCAESSRSVSAARPRATRVMSGAEGLSTEGALAPLNGAWSVHYAMVDAVEETGQLEDVYDLTVPTFHNFAVGDAGVFAHNCDAVEGSSYTVKDLRTDIAVSNWVLPAWFDPQNTRGPFDYLRTCSKPFEIAKNGYAVQWSSAGQQQVFGDEMPEWRREQKRQEMARGARRAGIGPSPAGALTTGQGGVLARALGKLRG